MSKKYTRVKNKYSDNELKHFWRVIKNICEHDLIRIDYKPSNPVNSLNELLKLIFGRNNKGVRNMADEKYDNLPEDIREHLGRVYESVDKGVITVTKNKVIKTNLNKHVKNLIKSGYQTYNEIKKVLDDTNTFYNSDSLRVIVSEARKELKLPYLRGDVMSDLKKVVRHFVEQDENIKFKELVSRIHMYSFKHNKNTIARILTLVRKEINEERKNKEKD